MARDPGPQRQPDVMGYHDAREIPNYWAYAEHFMLQDHMFAPTDSLDAARAPVPRLGVGRALPRPERPDELHARTSSQSGVVSRNASVAHPKIYAWTDITWLLYEHDVSWAYYVGPDVPAFRAALCPCGTRPPPRQNPLPGFTTVHENEQLANVKTHARLPRLAPGRHPPVRLVDHARAGASASIRAPAHHRRGTGIRDEAHQRGRWRSADWSTTAIFLTWDDWGGFYDHVVPPRVDENGYGIARARAS